MPAKCKMSFESDKIKVKEWFRLGKRAQNWIWMFKKRFIWCFNRKQKCCFIRKNHEVDGRKWDFFTNNRTLSHKLWVTTRSLEASGTRLVTMSISGWSVAVLTLAIIAMTVFSLGASVAVFLAWKKTIHFKFHSNSVRSCQ